MMIQHIEFFATVAVLLWMFLGTLCAVIGPLLKWTWPIWVHTGAVVGLIYMLFSIANNLRMLPL